MPSGDIERAEMRRDIEYIKVAINDIKQHITDVFKSITESCATKANVKTEVQLLRAEIAPYITLWRAVILVAATTLIGSMLVLP